MLSQMLLELSILNFGDSLWAGMVVFMQELVTELLE